jgi:hypothetical protein
MSSFQIHTAFHRLNLQQSLWIELSYIRSCQHIIYMDYLCEYVYIIQARRHYVRAIEFARFAIIMERRWLQGLLDLRIWMCESECAISRACLVYCLPKYLRSIELNFPLTTLSNYLLINSSLHLIKKTIHTAAAARHRNAQGIIFTTHCLWMGIS